MWIDVATVCILAYAGWQGFRKGLIMSVFSFAALFIGLAAAMKLSSMLAGWLSASVDLPSKWWPALAFIALLLVAASLVRNIGKLVQKTAEDVMLGPLNRMAGFLFYALVYLILYSILLFYMNQLGLISADIRASSLTFEVISSWGPKAVGALGRLIPFLGDVFTDLQRFFEERRTVLPSGEAVSVVGTVNFVQGTGIG